MSFCVKYCYFDICYTECLGDVKLKFVVILSVLILGISMLSIVLQSIVIISVLLLIVVTPSAIMLNVFAEYTYCCNAEYPYAECNFVKYCLL